METILITVWMDVVEGEECNSDNGTRRMRRRGAKILMMRWLWQHQQTKWHMLGQRVDRVCGVSCLQLYCTIVLLACLTKVRQLSKASLWRQTLRYYEVTDLPHHCLGAGLLVPMQDWAFLCRCLVLDRPNTSDSIRPKDALHETPSLYCSQTSSFQSCIKSILALLANPLFNSCSLNFFQTESALSSSSSCCNASLL